MPANQPNNPNNPGNQPNQQLNELTETIRVLKEGLGSLSAQIQRQLVAGMEDVDNVTKSFARTLVTDITRSLRTMGKESANILANQIAIEEKTIKTRDVEKQLNDLKLKETILKKDLETAEINGVLTAEKRLELENKVKEALSEQKAELEIQKVKAKDIQDIQEKIKNILDDRKRLELDISKRLSSSRDYELQIKNYKDKQKIAEVLLAKLKKAGLTDTTKEVKEVLKEIALYKELIPLLEKKEKISKSNEALIGYYGKTLQGLTKIPFLGNLIDSQKVMEKMNKTAADGGSKWKIMGVGIKETFMSIGESLINPANIIGSILGILTAIVKLVLDFENKTFEIAKNLGVSVDKAGELRTKFIDIANANKNAAVSSGELADAYGKINDQLGFMGPSSDKFVLTATLLEKRIGASAESMAALASYGALSGKTLDQSYKTLIGYAKVSMARNKLAMTERQVMDAVAKTSNVVLMNFKGNLPALAEAIVRAKKLGTTLDTINKQGDSLLDFENSIAAQFEAEVMTGRELNLTRARELALMGDTQGLMEELNRQNVSYGELMKMNVFQRESIAKSLGLSTEELTKQLYLQQQATLLGAKGDESAQQAYERLVKEGKTREEIAKKIGDAAEQQMYQASRAEQLQKTIENVKETLANMLSKTILPMVDKVIAWLQNSVNIQKVAEFLKGVFEKIRMIMDNLPSIMSKVITVLKVMVTLSIAQAVASITAGMGVISGPLAILAGMAAYSKLTDLTNGLLSGGGGGTTYATTTQEIPTTTPTAAPAASAVTPAATAAPAATTDTQSITPSAIGRYQPAQQQAAASTGGGGTEKIEVTANLIVDGDKLATTVINAIPRNKRGTTDQSTSMVG